jgi:uncharacterized protein (TIGR03032 family)
MSSTAGRLHHASAPRPAAFELTASRQFTVWLAEQKASLAFTTYQAGKLFLMGLQPDGQLSIFNRTFARCMGLWASPERLLMSSLYQPLALRECATARPDPSGLRPRLRAPAGLDHGRSRCP